jgi:hypothetical protein
MNNKNFLIGISFLFFLTPPHCYAQSIDTHGTGERVFGILAGLIFFIGLAIYFMSEMNRNNGGYSSGLESYRAGQKRAGCSMYTIAIIIGLMFLIFRGCSWL